VQVALIKGSKTRSQLKWAAFICLVLKIESESTFFLLIQKPVWCTDFESALIILFPVIRSFAILRGLFFASKIITRKLKE